MNDLFLAFNVMLIFFYPGFKYDSISFCLYNGLLLNLRLSWTYTFIQHNLVSMAHLNIFAVIKALIHVALMCPKPHVMTPLRKPALDYLLPLN